MLYMRFVIWRNVCVGATVALFERHGSQLGEC